MEDSLATELLHEVRLQAKRWFIAFCIMVGVEVATIAGFVWYISLPVEDVSVETKDGSANYIGEDLYGDLNNGENKSQEKSDTVKE